MLKTKPVLLAIVISALGAGIALFLFANSALFASKLSIAEQRFSANAQPITHFPKQASDACPVRQDALYAPCLDQSALIEMAFASAQQEGKTTLVSVGGNWCFWCVVLNSYWDDDLGDYSLDQSINDIFFFMPPAQKSIDEQAQNIDTLLALNTFVAQNFVVVHIDGGDSGLKAMENVQARQHYTNTAPFIFTLDPNGDYEQALRNWDNIEGFFAGPDNIDPAVLLAELKLLQQTAL